MTDHLFSDLVSNSSVQQSDLLRINSNESQSFTSLLYESKNHKILTFFNRSILVSDNKKCLMKHISSKKYHELLNSILIDKFSLNYISIKCHVQQINLYLTKLCSQCIFMASKEVSRINECQIISRSSQNSTFNNNGIDNLKSQLSFIRNICEKMTFMLNQPWILRSKLIKIDIPYPLKIKINILLKSFLDKFIININNIINISYFIIFTGLKCLSFSNIRNYSDDDFWNFSRGIEEFNKLYNHIKKISQSSLYKNVLTKNINDTMNYITKSIEPVCFVKNISIKNMFKIISTFRSTLMAERIHRFFYSSKDVFKAIRHRYLFVVLHPELNCKKFQKLSHLSDMGLDSYRSNNSPYSTTRSIIEDFKSSNGNELSENNNDKKYKKFIQRLSIKMKHSALAQEVSTEYEFILCLMENVLRSTDISRSVQLLPTISETSSSQTGRKSVQWLDSKDTSVRNHFMKYYLDLYWYQVDNYLDVIDSIIFGDQKQENLSKLGSSFIHNPAIKVALSNLMKEPVIINHFPEEVKPCLNNQSLKLLLSARLYMCDAAFCKALGYAHDDRFFSNQKCSQTCNEFLKILDTIDDGLQEIELGNNAKYFLPIIQKYLNILSITSAAIIIRTNIKYQKLMSSWNIASFIFLMFADTNILLTKLKIILDLIKISSDSNFTEMYGKIRKDFANYEMNFHKLKKIYSEMNASLINRVKTSVLICINDGFPEDESWLRKRVLADALGDTEIVPNDYVNSIISLNITPIASFLTFLDEDNEKRVIGLIVETIFNTLTSYLLEKKLRFSYIGACQLEVDINQIKMFLKRYISEDIFDGIISLKTTKSCSIIVDILKQQHIYESDRSKAKNKKGFKICSGSKAVLIEENSNAGKRFFDFSHFNGFLDNYIEWLKLRAHPIEKNVTYNSCM